MNIMYLSIILSVIIAFFCLITKPKQNEQENNTTTFIKVCIISFVCIYFGILYFMSPICPEINAGEPDF